MPKAVAGGREMLGHGSALGKQFEIPIEDLWSNCIQDIPAFSLKILAPLHSSPSLRSPLLQVSACWWKFGGICGQLLLDLVAFDYTSNL